MFVSVCWIFHGTTITLTGKSLATPKVNTGNVMAYNNCEKIPGISQDENIAKIPRVSFTSRISLHTNANHILYGNKNYCMVNSIQHVKTIKYQYKHQYVFRHAFNLCNKIIITVVGVHRQSPVAGNCTVHPSQLAWSGTQPFNISRTISVMSS